MSRRGLARAAGAAAIAAWALLPGCASSPGAPRAAIAAPAAGEPELVLQGVEMREARERGGAWRVVADTISYSLASKRAVAERVAIAVPSSDGDVVLRAARASWDTAAGLVRLDRGASAVNARGTSATVETGTLDLRRHVFSGGGRAEISGRGFSVLGDNLVWRWAEGTISLAAPRGRIEPAGLPRRKG